MTKRAQNKKHVDVSPSELKKASKSNVSVVMDCPTSLQGISKTKFLSNIATTARAYRILLLISDDPRKRSLQNKILTLILNSIGSKLKSNVLPLTTDEALVHIAEKEHASNSKVYTYWFVNNRLQLIPGNAARVAAIMRLNSLFMGLGSTSITSSRLVELARSEPMYGSVSKRQIRECWGSFPHQSPILPSEVFLTSSAAHTALRKYRFATNINVPAIMDMMSLSNVVIADRHTATLTGMKEKSRRRALVAA